MTAVDAVRTAKDGTQHAVLSPSSSERWISCPASVRVVEAMGPDAEFNDSIYAAEGTAAHALGEIYASHAFGKITQRQLTLRYKKWLREVWEPLGLGEHDLEEMEQHARDYVALLQERAALYPNTQLMLEQRMATGVPASWGTSDAVLVSPEHVEIVDLKYGQGVRVDAAGNTQLRLYACGALDTFGDMLGDTQIVRVTVFQPRLNNVSTEELTPDELREWRGTVAIPAAELALEAEDPPFGPSEEACRWCPAAGLCRARVEYMTAIDFARPPDLLEPEELGELLGRLPDIRAWVQAVEEAALTRAYSDGVTIPGWKVVMSGGQRTIKDPEEAARVLVTKGLPADDLYTRKLVGLGELEKLLKTLPKIKPDGATRPRYQRLEDVLPEELLGRTPGRESLVPEDDPRPAVNPNSEAAKEFSDEHDDA